MLEKFDYISNLGVFNDFNWNSEVTLENGSVQQFQDINIIYGRNYSGKTTLSRIMRALEKGYISDKYGTPSFSLKFSDRCTITQLELATHNKKIRVFNEDFIRHNLRFITNPDDSIEPFAILGDYNNKIEIEIEELELELGSNEQGKETCMYAKQKMADIDYNKATKLQQNAEDSLQRQLSNKATDTNVGIKYQTERFGDQNYNIKKLKSEIEGVRKNKYQSLTNEQLEKYEKLIAERVLPDIPISKKPNLSFKEIMVEAGKLVTKTISASDKIEELVKDMALNRWVSEGRSHHRNKHDKCAFCDNTISQERWIKLNKHFDEESDQLEKRIDSLIDKIDKEKKLISNPRLITQFQCYSKFHNKLNDVSEKLKSHSEKYVNSLNDLVQQLLARKKDILNPKTLLVQYDATADLIDSFGKYIEICQESAAFTSSLHAEQINAQKALRLKEVSDYLIAIDYETQLNSIAELKKESEKLKNIELNIRNTIAEKKELIITRKRELHDEEKGAKKVNEYLNNFFGHQFLILEAQKNTVGETSKNRIRFEVVRDGKKAYHLSEGECRLIAFCYFLAKLHDSETRNSKPIIWIDDPISSLDSNHIFFIYSLLRSEIVFLKKFKQLFISTHNLNFLTYLKRLKVQNFKDAYFVVVRNDKTSTIKLMPEYLKKYVTEFNYLFHQIHKCASIETVNDKNYTTFYNFANNTRKFFEIYLYYKYPDQGMTLETLRLFFGDRIPAILSERINNEYSHLSGVFERGATPIEVPEMRTAACQIIERLKSDADQYSSLLKSVGEYIEK